MKNLEEKELRGITIKQAITYLISVIGIVTTIVVSNQTTAAKLDKITDKVSLYMVEAETAKTERRKLETEIRALELRITILETKIQK